MKRYRYGILFGWHKNHAPGVRIIELGSDADGAGLQKSGMIDGVTFCHETTKLTAYLAVL